MIRAHATDGQPLTVREGTRIIADAAFAGAHVEEIILPEGLEIIGFCAFYQYSPWADISSSLKKILLPSSLTTIYPFAFCKTLIEEIHLPAALSEIGDYALSSQKLSRITVAEDNPYYTVSDGILYTKDMTELVCCPQSVTGELHLPATVKRIRPGAFCGNGNLTAVYLPEGVEGLENAAFGNAINYIWNIEAGYPGRVYLTPIDGPIIYVVQGTDSEEAVKNACLPFKYYENTSLTVTDADNIVKGSDGVLRVLTGSTAAQLLSFSNGSRIVDANGAPVEETAAVGTGMKLQKLSGDKVTDEIEVVVPGDADGDGGVSSADARLALRRSVGLEAYQEDSAQYKACDIDGAAAVSAADARLILRGSVGLEDPKAWLA